MRRTPIPMTRLIMTAALLLGGLGLLPACNVEGGTGDRRGDAEIRGEDGTASPMAGEKLSALLASPEVSFEVTFEWRDLYSEASGYFVWRQGNGVRRWDVVQVQAGTATIGQFSIEGDFHRDGALGRWNEGCMWLAGGTLPEGRASVTCSSGLWGTPWFSPVVGAVISRVAERLPDQPIATRLASCYSFDDPRFNETAFCLDQADGIPLALVAISSTVPHMSVAMRALSVSMAEQELIVPIELEKHPVTGIRQAEAVVPISTLQLPDLSEFEE